MDEKNLNMIPVPIPTEVPSPPNLEKLPLDILHSATVEMLIQQNEDLSSRLKVNIRRNSQLEQRIMDLNHQIQTKDQRFESLSAQNQIILEKEKIWTDQKEQKDRQVSNFQKEIDLLNLRYNELFATSQARQKEQQKQILKKQEIIDKLSKKIHTFNRIRLRAKERLRSFLIDTAENLYQTRSQLKIKSSSERHMQRQLSNFQEKVSEKENQFRHQLSELLNQVEIQKTEFENSMEAQIFKNDQLNSKLNAQNEEIHQLNIKFMEEKKNRAKLKQLSKDHSEAKNEALRIKKELSSAFEKTEDARLMEAQKAKSLEKDIKELNKQFNEHKETLRVCEDKLLNVSKDNKELSDQLESIQSLWIDSQEKLEKEILKRESLERINRELSQKFKDDKVKKATMRSQASPQPKSKDIKSQLSEVYASQYGPVVSKAPQMDV